MQLISRDEDRNFVRGECQQCGKILAVDRNLLTKSKVGFDISPGVTCSCGAVQTSIYKICVPEVAVPNLQKPNLLFNDKQINDSEISNTSQSSLRSDNPIKYLRKKYFLLAIIIILILLGVIGFNQYKNNIAKFNLNVSEAEKLFSTEEYDKAKEYYQSALKYKASKDIQSKVKLCDDLKYSLEAFNNGIAWLNDKNYLVAIEAFEKVIKEDAKRYSLANDKITEIKGFYIDEQLQVAKNFAKKRDYQVALDHLSKILVIDQYNQKALQLKIQYTAEKEKADKIAQANAEAEAKAFAKSQGVSIGMTQQQVLDSSWGKPLKVNRTTTKYGTHEQWVYNGYNYLYFEDGILTSIQN